MDLRNIRLEDIGKKKITIGKVAENLRTCIGFDCADIFAEYPDAVPALTVINPRGISYPAIVQRSGNSVLWEIRDSDLTAAGTGEIQLSFVQGEVIAKSYTGRIEVIRSIPSTGETPDPIEEWETEANAKLAEVAQALEDIPETIDTALEAAKESGEFDGQDGAPGAPGADGISPTVTVTDITGGHRVVITDAEGDHPFDVMDGQGGGGTVTVDDELSDQSTNPVQNKVITEEVTSLKEAIADKQDAPSVAGSSGQAMMLDNSGNPVWQTPPGGMVTDTVTGATVSITGQANHRYLCGTVTEITITPPQTGMIDVLFTAGNACVLSLPNTVKLPDSFDPTTLTQGVVYEINIMDGVYGVVGSWT